MAKEKILIHACCATCAGYVLEQLSADFTPVIYYCNPNIHPEEEYVLRSSELQKYAAAQNISFIEDPYGPRQWLTQVKGLENEPEKGLRCDRCFALRLQKTAAYALKNDISIFTTTLTISPHKSSKRILEIGQKIADENCLKFLARNFKKHDGYKKTMEIARSQNFYRQKYCGCVYSVR
jgi:hypothetical protein